MWSSNKSTSQGGTLRRILKLAFATIVAIFLWLGFANSIPVNAAPASWENNSIVYNNLTFNPSGTATGTKPPGIPKDSPYFTHIEDDKASIIYFSPDAPTDETSEGTLVTFSYNASTQTFSNPSSKTAIEIEANDSPPSSCELGFGVGWFICPITNMLASMVDYLYGVVTSFLEVQPLQINNTDGSLFKAWNAMRQIANVAFIIVFLILIYSQLTSLGISNYGIKKLLPSIIVGAILVNLSWFISALAVDLSNIMGYALQDFFMSLRGDLFVMTDENNESLGSWSSLSQFILSGGAMATGGALSAITLLGATFGSTISASWLLLPILVGVILSAIIVIIIFAARQALIIILIILSPIALIARILPNTENLYRKWFSTFMTMLIFFPAISILFGGAQLAGGLIVSNATSLNVAILGMAVQVAPLALSPFVLKFSGSLLGQIGTLLKNPKAAMVGKTRGYSEKQAKLNANRSAAGLDRKGNPLKPRRGRVLRGAGTKINHKNRRTEDLTSSYGKMADANYKNTQKYKNVYQQAYEGDQSLSQAEAVLDRDLKKKIQHDDRLLRTDMDGRLKAKQAELQSLKLDSVYEQMAAGDTPRYKNLSRIANGSEEAARDLALTAMAKNNSQRVQHTNISDALLENTATIDGKLLRDYAGGADRQYGADSALASAVSIQGENDAKLAGERAKLISHFDLNGEQRQELAMGKRLSTPVKDGRGYTYQFDAAADDYLHSAAVEIQFTKGSAGNKIEIIEASGISPSGVKGVNYDLRTDISDLVAKTGVPNSIAWLGGVSMDKITRGQVYDADTLKQLAFEHIKGGRFKAQQWYNNDAVSIDYAIDVIKNPPATASPDDLKEFYKGVRALQESLRKTGKDTNVTSAASGSTLDKIDDLINL